MPESRFDKYIRKKRFSEGDGSDIEMGKSILMGRNTPDAITMVLKVD